MIATLAINGITIGGVYAGANFVLTNLSGFSFPATEIKIRKKGHYNGAILDDYSYGARALSIEGEILGSNPADYESARQDFIQAFNIKSGLQTLTITTREGTVLTNSVIVSNAIEIPRNKGS